MEWNMYVTVFLENFIFASVYDNFLTFHCIIEQKDTLQTWNFPWNSNAIWEVELPARSFPWRMVITSISNDAESEIRWK